ncbi:hypothetical protein HZ326_5323 [Fusarium oxysporum f. sp. albedinis]|nr:hypothetical protein HZ326_5323 [Fusarium oxysporum f. sp. albedinis]
MQGSREQILMWHSNTSIRRGRGGFSGYLTKFPLCLIYACLVSSTLKRTAIERGLDRSVTQKSCARLYSFFEAFLSADTFLVITDCGHCQTLDLWVLKTRNRNKHEVIDCVFHCSQAISPAISLTEKWRRVQSKPGVVICRMPVKGSIAPYLAL